MSDFLTGNRGEWAEAYTFLKLLAEGKLQAADEYMDKIDDAYFSIIKIIREEVAGKIYDYKTGEKIQIFLNDKFVSEVDAEEFAKQADYLFSQIKKLKGRSFSVPETENFMRQINVNRVAEPSANKADIKMQIHDLRSGMVLISGFSIKSNFSSKAHLINSSEATNFIFEIDGFDDNLLNTTNSIDTRTKIIDRLTYINANSHSIKYVKPLRKNTRDNLILFGCDTLDILAQALLDVYLVNLSSCDQVFNLLDRDDPLGMESDEYYSFRMKKILCACALGLKIGEKWDRREEANGGYIIVKNDGDIVACHIYDRSTFEDFLMKNTKFEKGSTSKHNYCKVYKENEKYYIRLNLAVRFV